MISWNRLNGFLAAMVLVGCNNSADDLRLNLETDGSGGRARIVFDGTKGEISGVFVDGAIRTYPITSVDRIAGGVLRTFFIKWQSGCD